MARNRRDIDSSEKRAQIIAAARRLFLADGYEATGMARIAAEAGVAPNTLYWYFADKDALLIEILDARVGEALQAFPAVQSRPLDAQLLWLLEQLEAVPGLVNTVHARLAVSPALNAWHERFHAMVEAMVIAQLARAGMPEPERPAAARIALFVVEGLLSHHAGPRADRAAVAALLASRLAPAHKEELP